MLTSKFRVWDDFRSRYWFLVLSLLGRCFASWFLFPLCIFRVCVGCLLPVLLANWLVCLWGLLVGVGSWGKETPWSHLLVVLGWPLRIGYVGTERVEKVQGKYTSSSVCHPWLSRAIHPNGGLEHRDEAGTSGQELHRRHEWGGSWSWHSAAALGVTLRFASA